MRCFDVELEFFEVQEAADWPWPVITGSGWSEFALEFCALLSCYLHQSLVLSALDEEQMLVSSVFEGQQNRWDGLFPMCQRSQDLHFCIFAYSNYHRNNSSVLMQNI